MKKLLLIPFLVLFLISFVNADVSEIFWFQDQEGNSLTDVTGVIYNCLDQPCSQVEIPNFVNGNNVGNSNTIPPTNSIELVYPTNLETQHGYAIYFYKQGYKPMEYFSDYRGNGYVDSTITFQKKQLCSALIDYIEVLNDVRPNIPLVIGVSTSLDADTYSAFHSNTNTPAYIPEGYEDFYSAETKVKLNIYKADDLTTPIYTDEKTYKIFMDSTQTIQFTWTPTLENNYIAKITTEVIDDKCSSSKLNTAQAEFFVHKKVPQDACYTIVNRPGTSNPINAEVGEEITITGDKESYYIDEYQNIEPVDSDVTLLIFNSQNNIIHQETKNSFPFTWTPEQPGDYTIQVSGIANDAQCNGKINHQSQILIIPLTIHGKSEPNKETLELNFITNKIVNEGETLNFIISTDYNGDEELTYSIENLPKRAEFNPKTGVFTWEPDHNTVIHNIVQLIDIFLTERDVAGAIKKIKCRNDGMCEFNPIFKVSAGKLNDRQEVKISVKDVNQIPQHLNYLLDPYIVTEGDLLQIKPLDSFTDLDKDELTYTFTQPLDENGKWQTQVGDVGTYYSTITASDGKDTSSQDIKIVVIEKELPPENHAPEFIEIDDQTAYVGNELSFKVEATDQDKDPLTYSLSVIPTGATFSPETQEFKWTPTKTGEYGVGFIVKDLAGEQDFMLVKITVEEEPSEPENHAPEFIEIDDQTAYVGNELSFKVEATDQDEDPLAYSTGALPQSSTFENQVFTWTPTKTGKYLLWFMVEDTKQAKDIQLVKITVLEQEPEPTPEIKAIRPTKHNIGIQRVLVNYMDKVTPEEYFPVTVYAKNYAGIKEKDIQITVSLPELNQIQYSKCFDLKPKQTHLETLIFKLQGDTNNKQHVIAVTVSNNKDKETKYVFINME